LIFPKDPHTSPVERNGGPRRSKKGRGESGSAIQGITGMPEEKMGVRTDRSSQLLERKRK